MKFYYKAATKNGQIVNGFTEAKSTSEAAGLLRNQQMMPIKIVEQKSDSSPLPFFGKKKTFSSKELIFFTRQLSSMLASGLTLMQALRILKEQMPRASANEVIIGIVADIEGGSSFSDAIKKYPQIFSPVYISLIRAAETSGLMDKIIGRLAANLEQSAELKTQIKSAFFYPSIVVILMGAVGIIMVVFVIPQVNALYTSLNIDLPLPTKILLFVSNGVLNFWWLMILFVIGAVFFFRRWHKTPVGKFSVDFFLLRIPFIGNVIRGTIFAEFSRTFGLLVGAGSEILVSIKQAAAVVGNVIYEREISAVAQRIEKGLTVGDSMSASPLFPSYIVQMVRVGEQTGKMDESLLRASEYYEREVEQAVKTLTTAMEPAIIVILGIGVGFLMISVITPIYKLTSAI